MTTLTHHDMGPGFTHFDSAACGCHPTVTDLTTVEAIALIPPGWGLRLYEDRDRYGWIAELLHATSGLVVDTAATPAEAVRRAAKEAAR